MLGPDYESVLSDRGKSSYCMEVRNCSEDDICMASILTYTHRHTQTHTQTHTHTHGHTQTHTHTCTHTHTHTYIQNAFHRDDLPCCVTKRPAGEKKIHGFGL